MKERTTDDIFLVVGMIMIGYGFWDMTRLILIFGGTLIITIILIGGEDAYEGEDVRRP